MSSYPLDVAFLPGDSGGGVIATPEMVHESILPEIDRNPTLLGKLDDVQHVLHFAAWMLLNEALRYKRIIESCAFVLPIMECF